MSEMEPTVAKEIATEIVTEIATLEGMIQAVSSQHVKTVLTGQLSIIKALSSLHDSSPDEIHFAAEVLRNYVLRNQQSRKITKINATDITVSMLQKVFAVEDSANVWTLPESSLIPVPPILRVNLRDLAAVSYYRDSEATSRLAIDFILIQCLKHLSEDDIETNVAGATKLSTPTKAAVGMKRVQLFPESSMSIDMPNKSVPNSWFRFTGRADWSLGYNPNVDSLGGPSGDEGSLLIAIEAKQRSKFHEGEAQLIAYLTILRECRIKARKTNHVIQGFYSDGSQFRFICIKGDGKIEQSPLFTISFSSRETNKPMVFRERDLQMVFSFIVTMIDTAMKSTPNVTPTKPGPKWDREIHDYDRVVWGKAWADVDESIRVCEEADMEDALKDILMEDAMMKDAM